MRVLMLGWEYPPHISGGLGTACHGITRGLTQNGVDVLFVLPRAFGDEEGSLAEIRGCNQPGPRIQEDAGRDAPISRRRFLPVESPLRPYLTAAGYTEVLREAACTPAPAPTIEGPAPDAAAREFRGGYGQTLTEEVERYARTVDDLVRSEPFDLIHAHDWMTFPAGLHVREWSGKPLICHVHACEYDRAAMNVDLGIREIEQMGFDGCDRIVCVSQFTSTVLSRHYDVTPSKIRVVHNAVEPDDSPEGGPAGERGDEKIVLFLGRMTQQKGPDHFLRAAARVAAARPGVKFVMSGSGELLPRMKELADSLGISADVHFTGFLEGPEVDSMYRRAAVYVMPSVSEPFGLTSLEAISQGVPVIVSRQSGAAEVLEHALKVDYWDVDDLADKILAVLRHRVLSSQLVSEGQRVLQELGWETSTRRLLSVYGEIVA